MTPTPSVLPAATEEPLHGCVRCGARIPMSEAMCERCNPLGLKQPSASQAHGTVFVGIAVAVVALAVIARLAVSGIGLLAPGDTGQLNDGGPSAARTALAYAKTKNEMYVFQGGSYTPDQIQDLFRGLGSDTAILLDGGSSSAIVLRRDTGGMWAGAGVPRGSCDTRQVLCDARERALPSWLALN